MSFIVKASQFIQNCTSSFLSVIKVIAKGKKVKYDSNEKSKVLIIGNGPSINSVFEIEKRIKKIEQTDSICVNYFYKSPHFPIIKPKFYIVAGPELWTEKVGESYEKNRTELYEGLVAKVDWPMIFYIPFEAKKTMFWQDKLAENKHIKVEFYNVLAIEGFKKLNYFFYNKKLGMPRSHNIIGYASMLMIWNGYKELGLIGVEHSWTKSLFVSERNEAFLSQPHFYDDKEKLAQMNKDANESKRKLHEIIHKFYLAFKSYFEIRDYAKTKDIQIYNLTEGSFIDAFERKNENEFLFLG